MKIEVCCTLMKKVMSIGKFNFSGLILGAQFFGNKNHSCPYCKSPMIVDFKDKKISNMSDATKSKELFKMLQLEGQSDKKSRKKNK